MRQLHKIEILDGSNLAWQDRLKMGFLAGVAIAAVGAALGGLTAAVVENPGTGYTAVPTLSAAGGLGATFAVTMQPDTAVVSAAGTVYIPGQTITLTGGTASQQAILIVESTKVVSATVQAGGSGGTNGTQTVTGTTGTGTKFTASVTVAGGTITAVLSILTGGVYTANPTSIAVEPVTGASLAGAALAVVMGVNTVNLSNAGAYTVLAANPLAQGSTSGSGTGCTINLTSYAVASVAVSTPGDGYAQGCVITPTGANTIPAVIAGIINPIDEKIIINVTSLISLPDPSYSVFVTPDGPCNVSVSGKTNLGFNIELTPTRSGQAVQAGSVDIMIVG